MIVNAPHDAMWKNTAESADADWEWVPVALRSNRLRFWKLNFSHFTWWCVSNR